MGNKSAALLLLVAAWAMPAKAELLKLSLLEKSARPFTVRLDLFHAAMASGGESQSENRQGLQPVQDTAAQKTIAEEISQSISYEGYIVKDSRQSALLNVSGEFFMVREQEQILDKIKILKIDRRVVTIEYDGQPYDIKIKGDDNG